MLDSENGDRERESRALLPSLSEKTVDSGAAH